MNKERRHMEELNRHSSIEFSNPSILNGEWVAPGDERGADSARAESAELMVAGEAEAVVEDGFKGEAKSQRASTEGRHALTKDGEGEAESVAAATSSAAAGAPLELVGDEDEDENDDADQLPEVSRKVRRRRKRSRPRSRTIAMKRLTREELRRGALLYPPVEEPRPATRAECSVELRPCPWVACKHHLYLDVNSETGSIKLNFPDLEPWELPHTCALDVAERGGITLEEVGEIMNLTRERIRQVEVRGLLKLRMASPSPDELGANLLDGEE
jgi:hypothetical protein